MIWLIEFGMTALCAYIGFVVGCEDSTLIIICRAVFLVAFNILLYCANKCYEKLKSRIKALEDKLKDEEKTNGKT